MATRILIADDHEMMRRVLRNLINSHVGWQVCAEAKNGSEAVAQVKEQHPDLVVLDLTMPVMDGMRAAREIKKSTPDMRMIMFTLHASPEIEEQAKSAGIRRVVSKAQNGGRLVTAIEQELSDSQPEIADPIH
jgi:DNA-binding NarL/FixJ family response regulator